MLCILTMGFVLARLYRFFTDARCCLAKSCPASSRRRIAVYSPTVLSPTTSTKDGAVMAHLRSGTHVCTTESSGKNGKRIAHRVYVPKRARAVKRIRLPNARFEVPCCEEAR